MLHEESPTVSPEKKAEEPLKKVPHFSIAIPDYEDLRFRAGKLVMLSMKLTGRKSGDKAATKPAENLQFWRVQYDKPVSYYGSSRIHLALGNITESDFYLNDRVRTIMPGMPLLLLEDPYLVDDDAVQKFLRSKPNAAGNGVQYPSWYTPPVGAASRHWVLKVLQNEEVGYVFLTQRAWKHDLCIAHPRRIAKYGLK